MGLLSGGGPMSTPPNFVEDVNNRILELHKLYGGCFSVGGAERQRLWILRLERRIEALEKWREIDKKIILENKKEISELRIKFESYTTTNHTQAIREDQQKQITELQAKVSNPEWLDVVILELMEPQIMELKEQIESQNKFWHILSEDMVKIREVLLDFFLSMKFHYKNEEDKTFDYWYEYFRDLLKKLSGENSVPKTEEDILHDSYGHKKGNPKTPFQNSNPLGDCTSQCGKDWNDSFCSDCNDSKPKTLMIDKIREAKYLNSLERDTKTRQTDYDTTSEISLLNRLLTKHMPNYVRVAKEDLTWLLDAVKKVVFEIDLMGDGKALEFTGDEEKKYRELKERYGIDD